MKKFIYIIFALIILLSFASPTSYAHTKPEEISINDYAGVLSDSAKSYIKTKNDILYSQTEAKIIFVTTESTNGADIADYTQNLFSSWGISSFGRRNSIFVVVDTSKQEYSFSKGRNIRYAITDTQVYQYFVDSFEPFFSQKQYDKAILSLYNALAQWYETHYSDLNLDLDDNVDRYLAGEKTKDEDVKESHMWIWIAIGVCVVVLIIAFKVKRNIELKIRQHERRRLKKKFQIDIDKIVKS